MKHDALHTQTRPTGFTLIEMIASLAIVGILAAVAGIGLVQMTEGFFVSRFGADSAQKIQLAATRMIKEFNHIVDVSGGSNQAITFDSFHADEPVDTLRSFTLSWTGNAGDPLAMTCLDCIGGNVTEPLVDNVVAFDLTYIYYDTGGTLVAVASHTPEWQAAFTSATRQAAVRFELQLDNPSQDRLTTTVFLGKHD